MPALYEHFQSHPRKSYKLEYQKRIRESKSETMPNFRTLKIFDGYPLSLRSSSIIFLTSDEVLLFADTCYSCNEAKKKVPAAFRLLLGMLWRL